MSLAARRAEDAEPSDTLPLYRQAHDPVGPEEQKHDEQREGNRDLVAAADVGGHHLFAQSEGDASDQCAAQPSESAKYRRDEREDGLLEAEGRVDRSVGSHEEKAAERAEHAADAVDDRDHTVHRDTHHSRDLDV